MRSISYCLLLSHFFKVKIFRLEVDSAVPDYNTGAASVCQTITSGADIGK